MAVRQQYTEIGWLYDNKYTQNHVTVGMRQKTNDKYTANTFDTLLRPPQYTRTSRSSLQPVFNELLNLISKTQWPRRAAHSPRSFKRSTPSCHYHDNAPLGGALAVPSIPMQQSSRLRLQLPPSRQLLGPAEGLAQCQR